MRGKRAIFLPNSGKTGTFFIFSMCERRGKVNADEQGDFAFEKKIGEMAEFSHCRGNFWRENWSMRNETALLRAGRSR
jgi:hypothetical protein